MFTAQAAAPPPFPTFESSSFKALYDQCLPAVDAGEVLEAVRQLVHMYSQQQGVARTETQRFVSRMEDGLRTYKDPSLDHAADLAAQYVWTSHLHLYVGRDRRELCFILNHAIRSDDGPMLEPAARLAR